MLHPVTTILRKSLTLSVPILMAALVEASVQLLLRISSQSPYWLFASVVFNTIQSSAASIWQFVIRTCLQWSGSIPSQFAIMRLFRIRTLWMSTSSQKMYTQHFLDCKMIDSDKSKEYNMYYHETGKRTSNGITTAPVHGDLCTDKIIQ